MGKHHTEDYNQVETCEVFDCKRQSLQRWIQQYEVTGPPGDWPMHPGDHQLAEPWSHSLSSIVET